MPKKRNTSLVHVAPKQRGTKTQHTSVHLAMAGIAGGTVGALGGGYLVKAGVKPVTAAALITAGGVSGALVTRKKAMWRAGFSGMAAMGAGQLTLAFITRQAELEGAEQQRFFRQQSRPSVEDAFQAAREEMRNDDDDIDHDDREAA